MNKFYAICLLTLSMLPGTISCMEEQTRERIEQEESSLCKFPSKVLLNTIDQMIPEHLRLKKVREYDRLFKIHSNYTDNLLRSLANKYVLNLVLQFFKNLSNLRATNIQFSRFLHDDKVLQHIAQEMVNKNPNFFVHPLFSDFDILSKLKKKVSPKSPLMKIVDNLENIEKEKERKEKLHRHFKKAIGKNNIAAVEDLIKRGADVNQEFGGEISILPLSLAAKEGYFDIVKLLIKNNRVISQQDSLGNNALHHIARNKTISDKNLEIAAFLLDRKIDINAPDRHGFTPLMIAAKNNHVVLVKLLLEHGASIRLRNEKGKSAADIARDNNFTWLANFIEK